MAAGPEFETLVDRKNARVPGEQFVVPAQVVMMQQILMPHYLVVKNSALEGKVDEEQFIEASAASQEFGAQTTLSPEYENGPVQLRGTSEEGFVVITGDDFEAAYFDATASESPKPMPAGRPFLFDTFVARPDIGYGDDYRLRMEGHALMYLAGKAKVTRKGLFDYDRYIHAMGINDLTDDSINLTYEPLDRS